MDGLEERDDMDVDDIDDLLSPEDYNETKRTRTENIFRARNSRVIVIGATNRPDAVDPALRRPGMVI
jgi:AAA family ATPase